MNWDGIKGQEEAVNYLRQSLKKAKLVHAYLFQGPDGVGKTLTAQILAQALNCEQGDSDPCSRCPSCIKIERMCHPDVFHLLPQGPTRSLSIEQIREMQKLAHLNARMGNWKVFILEEADTMQEPASGSLLKTLEEPPPNTMIILISSRPEKLSETIRSRCQRIRFKSWSLDLLETFLKERTGLPREKVQILCHISGGRPGKALKMMGEGFFDLRRTVLETLLKGRLASGQAVIEQARNWLEDLKVKSRSVQAALEKIRVAAGKDLVPSELKTWERKDQAVLAAEKYADLELVFELLQGWFRDIYIFQSTGMDKRIINQDCKDAVKEQAQIWDPPRLLEVMDRIESMRQAALWRHVPEQLVFENLFLQLGFWRPTPGWEIAVGPVEEKRA